ncbi:MAG: thioredoxin domain-containing protein, partial [Chloroflexota bacterium]
MRYNLPQLINQFLSIKVGFMPNNLSNENSPYLLQHADNPVEWYPWGAEALEKARREDKPIFLSIGYAACHWCHVMAHESFEDPQTAALMNEHFVNIKVDREERPDLDGIYMNAVVAMTGQGGWPMSVFITPNGMPFYGGTYFPPVRRYGMPSFGELLAGIAQAWRENRDELLKSGEEITRHLKESGQVALNRQGIDPKTTEQASMALAQSYDWQNGGWGRAPKFPQPMTIEFLLRRAARGDRMARDTAIHALKAMARGGMYDVIGGGFARYSVDDQWLVPHFEKMLYDNAQLASVYLHAHLMTGEAQFRMVCEETLDFVARELRGPEGGFYSSLDADSEGEEGKYYVWSLDEVREVLKDQTGFDLFTAAYGVSEAGNFEGHNVLQRQISDEELADQHGIPVEQVAEGLARSRQMLFEARQKRVRPGTDDKALTSWNALMLAAFADAARYLQRQDYLEVAVQNANFLLNALRPEGRLMRSWRSGRAQHTAFLEDYAALILGLLSLYQSDPDPRWFSEAGGLAQEMLERFEDESGGFFDTPIDHESLIARPKDVQDNATPSGNALAAEALLLLAAFTGDGGMRDRAERMLGGIQLAAARYPTAFGRWLSALDFAIGPAYEVALVGDLDHPEMLSMRRKLWEDYRPRLVAAISAFPPPEGSPPLLKDRPLRN